MVSKIKKRPGAQKKTRVPKVKVAAPKAKAKADGCKLRSDERGCECYMCYNWVSTSPLSIRFGATILPSCGHAVHGYPCFLEMVTHGAEGGSGSNYRGCCRYCSSRLVFADRQRKILRQKLAKMSASAMREITSPCDVANYCYYLILGAVDIFGMRCVSAPLDWHNELKRGGSDTEDGFNGLERLKLSKHIEARIRTELERHLMSPHFEVAAGGEVVRISVAIGPLRNAERACAAAAKRSERRHDTGARAIRGGLGDATAADQVNDDVADYGFGVTASLAKQMLDIAEEKRRWITVESHPEPFQALAAYASREEVARRLPPNEMKDDSLYKSAVSFEAPGRTISGVVEDVVMGLMPFMERRYQVQYEDGSSEHLCREDVELMQKKRRSNSTKSGPKASSKSTSKVSATSSQPVAKARR